MINKNFANKHHQIHKIRNNCFGSKQSNATSLNKNKKEYGKKLQYIKPIKMVRFCFEYHIKLISKIIIHLFITYNSSFPKFGKYYRYYYLFSKKFRRIEPGRRNCVARQGVLQNILNLADKSSKRNAII